MAPFAAALMNRYGLRTWSLLALRSSSPASSRRGR